MNDKYAPALLVLFGLWFAGLLLWPNGAPAWYQYLPIWLPLAAICTLQVAVWITSAADKLRHG